MLKTVILLLLAIMQVRLIYSGDILYYLAPQMLPFFYFSTFCFLVLAAYKALPAMVQAVPRQGSACDCGCPAGHESKLAEPVMYVLFGLLLCLGFFMPPKLLDSAMVEKKGIIYHQTTPRDIAQGPENELYTQPGTIDHEWWAEYQFDSPASESASITGEQQALREELGIWYDADYYSQLVQRLLGMDRIVVEDKGFLDIMLVLAAYQTRFQNREIELTGFVYRDMAMSQQELAVTRTAITCCLADATFYGILVRGDDLQQFEQDSWIRVRGLIDQDYVFDQNMIMITALEVENIPVPESPYVYPYLFRQFMPLEP